MTCLIMGATGFVGRHLRAIMPRETTRWGTRRPVAAARASGPGPWVACDANDEASLRKALEGVDSVAYLVHGMGSGGDYEAREAEAARLLARMAEAQGVGRIVYLGGVCPEGHPSHHLQSRARTGRLLASGRVPVVELRASMIVGPGSDSWHLVRDLSYRLPVMVLPRWLRSRSAPVAIWDVVEALKAALEGAGEAGIYSLPGPHILSSEEILRQVADCGGLKTRALRVPMPAPGLSKWWIRGVTGAPWPIVRELVEGLIQDLEPEHPPFWDQMEGYAPMDLKTAVVRTLAEERRRVSPLADAWEHFVARQFTTRGVVP